ISYINQTLLDPEIHTIFIDATHLNKRSRNKTLSRIRKNNIEELICVCFDTSIEVCQARNALRAGRTKVPAKAIENMFNSYSYPTPEEGFDKIYIVNKDGIIKEVIT
ncbi:MAG: AAA family ATPase, partial [Tyzzerella sp.]|nr:AAA family ATPase [Tyzzerella sp.]